MSLIATLLLALLAYGDAGSKGPRPAAAQPASTEVCSLLGGADLRRVHRAEIVSTKPSESPGKGFRYLQCFYRAKSLPDSVILTITSPEENDPGAARRFWEETIVKAAQTPLTESEPTTKTAAKQQRHKPAVISGLGDEAWWVGNRYSGALYALKGDRFLRISVGGKLSEEEKKQRSIALARLALERLK